MSLLFIILLLIVILFFVSLVYRPLGTGYVSYSPAGVLLIVAIILLLFYARIL